MTKVSKFYLPKGVKVEWLFHREAILNLSFQNIHV